MSRRSWLWSAYLVLGACGTAARNAAPWSPDEAPDLGPVVARVDGVPIFATQVRDQAARSGVAARQALDTLVSFHLLAGRARGGWPPDGAEAARVAREIMVQRFLEREFEPGARKAAVPDSELRALYQQSLQSFLHPRMVEVAALTVAAPSGGSPQDRERSRAVARALQEAVRSRPARTPEDFQALAGDPAWAPRGVRFYRFLQRPQGPYTPAFAAAIQALKAAGDTTGVIEDDRGFHLARFVSDVPAKNRTFEDAREELLDGHYERWRQARFAGFSDRLAQAHEIALHPEHLPRAPGPRAR